MILFIFYYAVATDVSYDPFNKTNADQQYYYFECMRSLEKAQEIKTVPVKNQRDAVQK